MARPRKMTTEQMISVVDSYYLVHAQGNEKRLKCSLIAAYAVELGYQVQGYDFTRNMEVREHIERMKCYAEVQAEMQTDEKIGAVYKSLDVAGFISSNRELTKLARSLTELDAYWKRVYEQAEVTAEQNRRLMCEKAGYEAVRKDLIKQAEELKTGNAGLVGRNGKLEAENRYLRKMLRKYLYPAVANEILLKENALKDVDTTVTEAAIMDMTEFNSPKSFNDSVSIDLDIQHEEEQLIKKMWGLCDE